MSTDCPVCVLCGLTPVESMSARGMRPFCRMVMMRATIADRFFHNRVFKISRYCKILGCYLYLCRQIAYFLNNAKTEKEIVQSSKEILLKNGFVDISQKETLVPGDKIFYINRGRCLYAAVIGSENMENGFNIIAAHCDSPRIDLKQNPLYEDGELAMLKTHYYGGIKKYQWTNIPLSMHGTIVKPDGEKINVCIGEKIGKTNFTCRC